MKIFNRVLYKWLSDKFMDGCSNFNTAEVRRSCRSKLQARTRFREGNVPHAKGTIFLNPLVAHRFAKEHGFPLVIKPNVSGFSRGSYFPIENYRQLWKAIALAKLWWPTTVVEQYLKGSNYRVLVANGRIVSVLERYTPHVIGNGRDSIATLIDDENQIRREMGLMPVIHPIPKNQTTQEYLAKQGMTLESIPREGQQVDTFYRIALAPGGSVRTIDQATIPAKNQALFLKVLDLFEANILGIDVIFEHGIETEYDAQKCIFLEVNSRPYLKMHDYPRHGKKDDLSAELDALSELVIEQADVL